jgi:rod shape-determining protein MreD
VISLPSTRVLAQASVLLVPLLSLASPGWLQLNGMEPAWAVFWLLPWSLMEDRLSALFAALTLGLLLDALHPGPVSLLPGLLLLAWWWSGLGRRRPPRNSLILGLLALLGTAFLDLTLLLQWMLQSWRVGEAIPPLAEGMASRSPLLPLTGPEAAMLAEPLWHRRDLLLTGIPMLLAQTLITALLAPMLCSLLLLLWRQPGGGGRSG